MITKVTFEPEDFKSGGQMIIRNSSPVGCTDLSFAGSVSYKIGWLATRSDRGLCMVALTDGMIIGPKSPEELCSILNDDDYGYRPMTAEEIKSITERQGNRFYA